MKAIVIAKETLTGVAKGAPDLAVGYRGFVFVGGLPGANAIYVVTGSGAQLTNIQADPNCVGGALITESGIKWGEMNVAISTALLTKINIFRVANGQATIPASTTLLQVVRLAATHFTGDGSTFDVWDG